jgi:hypothetical protein
MFSRLTSVDVDLAKVLELLASTWYDPSWVPWFRAILTLVMLVILLVTAVRGTWCGTVIRWITHQ